MRDGFIEDCMAEQVDVAELVMLFQRECGITIPPHEAEQLRTVGDVLCWLENYRGDAPEGAR